MVSIFMAFVSWYTIFYVMKSIKTANFFTLSADIPTAEQFPDRPKQQHD
jgi:hypothetical protein